ncbi:P-loop containing nucleoside triphosphate hydrolase protein [Zychaea mexicana]|uniref:P-loop containing nucleoside triphosphate hydrolase protein n=1 Tax=Zychaea mexicana TaxID=64656 RepID=UPI0022FE0A09|nr:P-loop containing nucleoside triphosphate hydrolase protein [Zychaea mexicana]KAI9484672.1 P-loop containing nucleoside triphosphate hydrolase protein [Zychaea mexicana]
MTSELQQQQQQQNSDDGINAALAPLFSTFSLPQLESVLYAFLPSRIERHVPKTGIYAVDTFVVTATVTFILVAAKIALLLANTVLKKSQRRHDSELETKGDIAIVIEPMTSQDEYHTSKLLFSSTSSSSSSQQDKSNNSDTVHLNNTLGLLHAHYNSPIPPHDAMTAPNVFHQALSHLVSRGVQSKGHGYYTMKPNLAVDHSPLEPPAFNIVPQTGQAYSVKHEECTLYITFQTPTPPPITGIVSDKQSAANSGEPSIRISMIGCRKHGATVSSLATFLNKVAHDYLVHMDSLRKQTRSRYDYSASGQWLRICSLYENQGLQTVALCPKSEALIAKDLETFVQNKGFYKRIGAPYVRGYLLHGKPGTGKTSLIFAIASFLKRHLYFMNLSYIDSDSELSKAFASVPANSIVVFEDIDTMTTTLHRRTGVERAMHAIGSEKQDNNNNNKRQHRFNLSTFLSILDGHTLEEGIIFIMTSNHPKVLDPAIIRPGRMDVHLDLTFATHYQMRRMYRMVLEEGDPSTLDDVYSQLEQDIPEFVIPPSEIMQIMVLCREHVKDIPAKLRRLTEKYQEDRGSDNASPFSVSSSTSQQQQQQEEVLD